MKKIISLLLSVSILCSGTASLAEDEIKVFLNGGEILYDVPPQIIDERTMTPVRATFEAMGMEVEWNERLQRVTARGNRITLRITVGSDIITKNGREHFCDTPAVIIDGRVLIPLRAVSELSEYEVEWNGDTRTVNISDIAAQEQSVSDNDDTAEETPADPFGRSIALSQTKLDMFVGNTCALTAASGAANDSFLWSSSDNTVAAVDQSGNVRALYPGTCRITAESRTSGKKKKCTVNVGYQNTALRFPSEARVLTAGDKYSPKLLVTPEDERGSITWESSDKSIASVKNGIITANTAGTAVITASTALGITAAVTITVNAGGKPRLQCEIESSGAVPGTKAAQGAPVKIDILNKSDTDIYISTAASLRRSDGSLIPLTLSRFSSSSKTVTELDKEVKITKGSHKTVSFALKNDEPPEGFSFKYGDKITMRFDCGGNTYEGIVDRNGVININENAKEKEL